MTFFCVFIWFLLLFFRTTVKQELENNQQKFKYIFRCSQFLLLFVNYHLNSRNTPFDVPLNVKLVFLKPGQCISRKPLHHYFKDQPSFHLVATAWLVPPATCFQLSCSARSFSGICHQTGSSNESHLPRHL